MASPFFFAKKKDGALQPIQDYHRLNDITVKNHYPLPLITKLIDTLQNAKYFTKLDVQSGYNNVHIKVMNSRQHSEQTTACSNHWLSSSVSQILPLLFKT
jgi:hypothetical protein